MRPDVVVDIGNSRIKMAAFNPVFGPTTAAVRHDSWSHAWQKALEAIADGGLCEAYCEHRIRWAVAGVSPTIVGQFVGWINKRGEKALRLTTFDQLPIRVAVDQPETVGLDRLLGAVAANARRRPGMPAVTVDAGTALTVNAVGADGRFLGGTIAPGLQTMRNALHTYTAKLPKVDGRFADAPEFRPGVPATTTKNAIFHGTEAMLIGGARWTVVETAKALGWADFDTFVTGGDGESIAKDMPHLNAVYCPHLVLEGIRLAAEALP